MHKMERPSQPDCLATHTTKWTQAFVDARQQNPKYPFRWPQRDCYQAIRKRLSDMTQAHCAFCDGRIGTESRETIEHFRPKSQFPSFAYQWDNLFPCCDMCHAIHARLFRRLYHLRFQTQLVVQEALDLRGHCWFQVVLVLLVLLQVV